jgi:predicted ferric reductase
MKAGRLRGSSLLGRPRAMFFRVAFHRSTAARGAGPAAIVVLVVAWAAIWLALRPLGQGGASYVGQLCGAESILLLSIALVLISTLPWVEVWCDGIDRAAIWHRRAAITGVVLLVPHILLSKSSPTGGSGKSLGIVAALGLLALVVWAIVPRWRSVLPRFVRPGVVAVRDLPGLRHARALLGGYERWRSFHRLTGVFVAIAFVHGILDATPFSRAPVLRWIYVTTGGIGLAFYLYRELLARHFVLLHDYQVEHVELFDDGMMEISLKPLALRCTSSPASSRCCISRLRPAGDVTRSRSPARPALTSCGSQ